MKIGLLTFHRAHNFGAVLQCYALQEVLKHFGFVVEVIDYREPYTENYYRIFRSDILLSIPSLKGKLFYVISSWNRFKRAIRYKLFRLKYLNMSPKWTGIENLNYDFFIIGSDQVWSRDCLGDCFNDIYLGKFLRKSCSKIIGYAISSNIRSIDCLNNDKLLPLVFERFAVISFREVSVIERLKELTGVSYAQCIDPTLLTNMSMWENIIDKRWSKKRYVVLYRLRDANRSDMSVLYKARKIATDLGVGMVEISSSRNSVVDFVSAIANAEYVVTTSFHATVFSLIFHKQFASYLLHDGNDGRYEDLLRKVGAEECIYEIDEYPHPEILPDWEKIEKRIGCIREQSLNFLKENLV